MSKKQLQTLIDIINDPKNIYSMNHIITVALDDYPDMFNGLTRKTIKSYINCLVDMGLVLTFDYADTTFVQFIGNSRRAAYKIIRQHLNAKRGNLHGKKATKNS